jgi:hypothetical protein
MLIIDSTNIFGQNEVLLSGVSFKDEISTYTLNSFHLHITAFPAAQKLMVKYSFVEIREILWRAE